MDADCIASSDGLWMDRLRTLVSVDHLVDDVVSTLANTGELNRTFIFYTADHGCGAFAKKLSNIIFTTKEKKKKKRERKKKKRKKTKKKKNKQKKKKKK